MAQYVAQTAVVVNDYDEAIDFYVNILGFELIEDTPQPEPHIPEVDKRWVVVAPPDSQARLLLAKATTNEQKARIGNQTGGRVFLFLYTDDFWRDYKTYVSKGVEFVRGEPRQETYGTVAVFLDICGNMWDLIETAK